jgi:hypothetical protein
MNRMTIFVTKSLIEYGLISKEALEEIFKGEGSSLKHAEFGWFTKLDRLQAAKDYNNEIENGFLPGRSIITKQLSIEPVQKSNELWLIQFLKDVNECFAQIDNAIRVFCPKYTVNDFDFPFSPNQHHRVLDDGSEEKQIDNVYILSLDIIKGTYSEQTNKIKEFIRNTMKEFKSKGLVYENTGNDAFVACAEDVNILWDIANIIRLECEAQKKSGEPFDGTRKGLFYGSVFVVTKPNGEIILHDLIKSNVIPASMYILPGIDKNVDKDKRNSVIIIDKQAFKLCADKLKLTTDKIKKVSFNEKHFEGECYIADLV